jgi:hypothetical protein
MLAGPEEEKLEETADKTMSVQIADLQKNIVFLSRVHSIPQQLILCSRHHDHQTSLLALFCVFII